jgi:copper chaperone CopZ
VYKPRICICPRDCCIQEESPLSGCDIDADVCCDASDACCKQACCQADVNPEQSECASDECKDECCAESGCEDPCESVAESCCEDECCGKKPQRVKDTVAGGACCDDCYDCEKPSSNDKPLKDTWYEEEQCCDDCYDCEKTSKAVPPVTLCTDGCCGPKPSQTRATISQSGCCEGEGCNAESTTNKCSEKICCGTDFCQCKPTADFTVPYLAPKVATSRDSQPGGGCNGPGEDECAGGCCGEVPKERLLVVEDDSCCDSQAEAKESSCADDCCQSQGKMISACNQGKMAMQTSCNERCCDDDDCDDSPTKLDPCCEDSCCDEGDTMDDPETKVTIHNDANIQKVVLSIKGMTCAGCVATAERRLKATTGIESYKISLITTKAEIFYDKHKLTPQDIIDAINALSFTATLESTALRVNMTCDAIETTLPGLAEIVSAIDGVDSVAVNEKAVESCWMPKQSATDSVTVSYDPAAIGIRNLLVSASWLVRLLLTIWLDQGARYRGVSTLSGNEAREQDAARSDDQFVALLGVPVLNCTGGGDSVLVAYQPSQ